MQQILLPNASSQLNAGLVPSEIYKAENPCSHFHNGMQNDVTIGRRTSYWEEHFLASFLTFFRTNWGAQVEKNRDKEYFDQQRKESSLDHVYVNNSAAIIHSFIHSLLKLVP